MMNIENKLMYLANSYLNDMINRNHYLSLDLPADFCELNQEWKVEYRKHSQYSAKPIYISTNHFKLNDIMIAKYRLILTENLDFVDEFFIII